MNDNEKVVIFDVFETEVEANIVKGVLETNGIIAGVLVDNTANTLMRYMPQGDARVVVFERDLERAKQIMDANPIESLPESDDYEEQP